MEVGSKDLHEIIRTVWRKITLALKTCSLLTYPNHIITTMTLKLAIQTTKTNCLDWNLHEKGGDNEILNKENSIGY